MNVYIYIDIYLLQLLRGQKPGTSTGVDEVPRTLTSAFVGTTWCRRAMSSRPAASELYDTLRSD